MKAAFLALWSGIIFGAGVFLMALAQQTESVIEIGEELTAEQIAALREEAAERASKLQAAYRSNAVRANCIAEPTARFPATVDGEAVMIDCLFWTRWYESEQERLREQAEAAPAP